MKKMTSPQIVRRCINDPRLGFHLTLQAVKDALDTEDIVIDSISKMYEQNNIHITLRFDTHGHEGALNVNLIFDE